MRAGVLVPTVRSGGYRSMLSYELLRRRALRRQARASQVDELERCLAPGYPELRDRAGVRSQTKDNNTIAVNNVPAAATASHMNQVSTAAISAVGG